MAHKNRGVGCLRTTRLCCMHAGSCVSGGNFDGVRHCWQVTGESPCMHGTIRTCARFLSNTSRQKVFVVVAVLRYQVRALINSLVCGFETRRLRQKPCRIYSQHALKAIAEIPFATSLSYKRCFYGDCYFALWHPAYIHVWCLVLAISPDSKQP